MSVCSENYDDMLDLIEISKKNSDLIQCLTLAIYQDISYGDKNKQMTRPDPDEVIDIVCKEFNSKPCAYLGKIINKDKPSWLYIDPVFRDNKVIRYFSPKEYKEYWDKMYQDEKLKLLNYNVLDDGSNLMTVHILITPQKINGKYDLCEGCPDAMYYEGKLVPSCLLERIKKGETIEII